jgi:hypothetical protein
LGCLSERQEEALGRGKQALRRETYKNEKKNGWKKNQHKGYIREMSQAE